MRASAQRHLSLALAIVVTFFLTYQIVQALSVLKHTVSPSLYFERIAICLAAFFLPILGGWFSYRFLGGIPFAIFGSTMVFFAGSIAGSPVFIWFLLEYGVLCFLLSRLDYNFADRNAMIVVDREQFQNKRNDLDISFKTKGEGISILFEKYSTYYNMRKLAEELALTLSVTDLTQQVVNRALDFIPRGDISLLSLTEEDGQVLRVNAYCQSVKLQKRKNPISHPAGDHFDYWVIKNRRRLIVTDAQKDFRFDFKETSKHDRPRSLIMTPLLHQGRIMGTLRIHSGKPDIFSNDDLRLLDTISVLASSAVYNAALYEQTEELAIKDSLTGLYVRRYFFNRFEEEHKRALLTRRPLSLLMCDLDYFKECNDRFGHRGGDLMLIQFGELLRNISENAVVARYGGEEFSVLLPETSKEDAVKMAESLRHKVENQSFTIRRNEVKMTISVGISSMPKDTLDLESMVKLSDDALYRAKREGRNRVCLSAS